MVTEIAIIDAKPGQGDEFAIAYVKAHPFLATTPGCRSAVMTRSEEAPDRFIGIVEWESAQAHLENFAGTDRYRQYATILGPYVEGLPRVEHFTSVATG